MTITYTVVGVILAIALWWWFFGRNTPKYPPLDIDDNDPRMVSAVAKAKATIDTLRNHWAGEPQEVQVKLPFLSNSGETEHLWAEVLELSSTQVDVRYLSPPVTHTGKLDRFHTHPISDIEDWVVFLETGDIYGGYTQRVMFEVARDQYDVLPSELEEQEARYRD